MFTALLLTNLAALQSPAHAQDDDPPEAAEETDGFQFSTTGKWKDGALEDTHLMLDNTAYTIGRNQVLISPTRVAWGVLDNVEVGSNLILDVFEIYNVRGKVTAIDMERLSGSFEATYFQPDIGQVLGAPNLNTDVLALDWRASVRPRPGLGLHFGQSWYLAKVGGDEFGLGEFGQTLARLFGEDLSDEIANEIDAGTEGISLYGGLNLNVRRTVLSADYMPNRRDQFILIWSALTQARGSMTAGSEFENAQDVSAAQVGSFGFVADFDVPTSDLLSNSITIAWQLNWELFHLRLGFTPPIGGVDQQTVIYNTLTEGIQAYWIF